MKLAHLMKLMKEIFYNPNKLREKRLLKILSKLSPAVNEKRR